MFGEQEVACRLAVLRIADEDRCDWVSLGMTGSPAAVSTAK
jgi:hypothetical protein